MALPTATAPIAAVTDTESTNFYWVDGGNSREVSCNVTVDGQTSPAVQATFDVDRPSFELTEAPTGTIAISSDPNYYPPNDLYLHYGVPYQDGVAFATIPPKNSTLQLAQLVVSYDCKKTINSIEYHYVPTNGVDQYPSTGLDSPGVDVESPVGVTEISLDTEFETWLMYTSPTAGSVPVPLQVLSWHWSASATKHGDTWQSSDIDPNPIPPAATTGTDTYDYPTWSQKIKPNTLVDKNGVPYVP